MSISVEHMHRSGGSSRRRSLLLAARVRLHRGSLNRALAAGANPDSSRQVALRAEQLTSPHCRRSLAAGLNRTLRAAEAPARPLSAVVPVQRREILAARDEIERLAHDLLVPGEVQARGVVLVRNLLTDGASPFFSPTSEAELRDAVRHAHAALLLR